MSKVKRFLNPAEQVELDAMNHAVFAAIQARRKWLDAKMTELAALQIGDPIYDVNTGERLGVVTELYRFWRDRDAGVRDDSLNVEYRYTDSAPGDSVRCSDNTSSQPIRTFGTKEEAIQRAQAYANWLARKDVS